MDCPYRCDSSNYGYGHPNQSDWYDSCRDTLILCATKWPMIRRIWQLRDSGVPIPKELFEHEEIALHVSEPLEIEREYKIVSESIGRELPWYTRHGGDRGRLWSDEPEKVWKRFNTIRPANMLDDMAHIHSVLPDIVDITKRAHYTIGSLGCSEHERYTPEQLTYHYHKCFDHVVLDHILFHPEHISIYHEEFIKVMDLVKVENERRQK